MEPTRFAASSPQLPGTLGFDLSLFKWNVSGLWPDDYRWQFTFAVDLASDYGAVSFGIGGWY